MMRRARQIRLRYGNKRMLRQVMRNPASTVDCCPLEFFKVFLPDHATQGLSIPPDFMNHLKNSLPQKAILTNRSGKTWNVNLEKEGSNVLFKGGWKAFLRDSSLEVGDFLLFTYNGESKFSVKVYGPNGCEKEKAQALRINNNWGCSNDQEEDTKPVISICPDGNRNAQDGPTSVERPRTEKANVVSERYPTEAEQKLAIEEARRYVSKSKNPSFSVVMTPTYIRKRIINVPWAFINEHLGCINKPKVDEHLGCINKPKVELQMVGRVWPVRLLICGTSCKFGRQWHDFVIDNNLRLKDVCVFELVKETSPFFRMSVFRCLKE